jgi:hypothetical protein
VRPARDREVTATYDSRETPEPYTIEVRVDGKLIEERGMDDPFVTSTTRIGTKDIAAAFADGKEIEVVVRVGAPHWLSEDVTELDANYRGEAGSRRRAASDARMQLALHTFAEGSPD